MLKQLFGNSGWIGKLVQLVLISLLFMMTGVFIWMLGGGRTGVENSSVYSLKILQLTMSVFLFILPLLFLAQYWYENPAESLHFTVKPTGKQIILVLLLAIAIIPFINLLAYFNEQIQLPNALKNVEDYFKVKEKQAANTVAIFLNVSGVGGYLFNLFLMALIPAFGEELFFRGAVQNIFSEKFSKHAAVWIAAALFSLIHFQMYGFIPRMMMGAAFGYILVWTRTLWLPILAHLLNNTLAISVSFFMKNTDDLQKIENIGKADTLVYGIISGFVTLGLLWLIYKSETGNMKSEVQRS